MVKNSNIPIAYLSYMGVLVFCVLNTLENIMKKKVHDVIRKKIG